MEKITNTMTPKKAVLVSLSGLLVMSGAIYGSYSVTKYLITPSNAQNTDQVSQSASPVAKPVDAESFCPLNGKKYTLDDQVRWETKHPVAVMIENHPESRPQSGLSAADMVYEAVAEGGITRFMAVFLCEQAPQLVGPVRSARTYFLDWLSEYNAYYAHVGGANTDGPADSLQQIIDYGIKDFEGLSENLQQGWQRDRNRLPDVALEHTMYLDIERLRKFAKDTWNWDAKINGTRWDTTFEKYTFTDEQSPYAPIEATSAATISYEFWPKSSGMFGVEWGYDPTSKVYKRNMAGRPHADKNTDKQIEFSNIVILLQEQTNANDGYINNLHLLYKTIGKGNGWVINYGKAEKAIWSKSGRTARTKFTNSQGKEIPLARGKTWISIVPTFSEEAIVIK